MRPFPSLAAVLALSLPLAACADDGDGGSADPTDAPGGSEPVTTVDDGTGAPTTTTETSAPPGGQPGDEGVVVFSGQGNDLVAYEATPPFASQVVITNAIDDPETGRDINAQICFWDDPALGRLFVAGEDTGQPDPPAGWGIFGLDGTAVGELAATQIGKLTPTYQPGADPENLGCGRLSDGRLLTTDIGNQDSGDATGQLIVWFPPFDRYDVDYCKVDVAVGTAQQILVDDQDRAYVASSLGRGPDNPAGVYRYSGDWPTGPDPDQGCDTRDGTGAPLTTQVTKELFLPTDPETGMAFPAGLAWSPEGGLYVSSVATGVINHYDADGTFLRTILRPPEGEELDEDSYSTGTPLGLATTPAGTLFVADIGVVRRVGADGTVSLGPGDGTGRVLAIPFGADGEPGEPVVVDQGLDYPDHLGVLVP